MKSNRQIVRDLCNVYWHLKNYEDGKEPLGLMEASIEIQSLMLDVAGFPEAVTTGTPAYEAREKNMFYHHCTNAEQYADSIFNELRMLMREQPHLFDDLHKGC